MKRRAVLAFATLLALTGCSEPWQKIQPQSLGARSLPPIRVEKQGTGESVVGAMLVETEIEVLETGAFVTRSLAQPLNFRKKAWLWTGTDPPGVDQRLTDARFAVVGRPVGSVLVVDAMSRGKVPPPRGLDVVYGSPVQGDSADLTDVYDSVYRIHILRACPATVWTRRDEKVVLHPELNCKGDFLPTSCSWPSLWKTSSRVHSRIEGQCRGRDVEFAASSRWGPPR